MGRTTPSFRQVYLNFLAELRKKYAPHLKTKEDREAFGTLVREAWDPEHASMGNAQIPYVADIMNKTELE